MKLTIPRPVSEIDESNLDPIPQTPIQRIWQGRRDVLNHERNPDYTNEGSYPEIREQGALYVGNGIYVDQELRAAIVADCILDGCIPGAIVVHKKIAKDKRTDPLTWGIVISHNSVTSKLSVWKPVRVKWVSGSYDDVHAVDLIVMINVPDQSILKRRAMDEPKPNPL